MSRCNCHIPVLLASPPLPPTVEAVLREALRYYTNEISQVDLFNAVSRYDNAGRPGLTTPNAAEAATKGTT